MTKEKSPMCCEGCKAWPVHGKNCWYFWELKKDCTMHSTVQEKL